MRRMLAELSKEEQEGVKAALECSDKPGRTPLLFGGLALVFALVVWALVRLVRLVYKMGFKKEQDIVAQGGLEEELKNYQKDSEVGMGHSLRTLERGNQLAKNVNFRI